MLPVIFYIPGLILARLYFYILIFKKTLPPNFIYETNYFHAYILNK